MDPATEQLVHFLKESLRAEPAARKQGEEYLKEASTRPGFLISLLKLQTITTVDPNVRLAAAVFFKNFAKLNWSGQKEDAIPISDPDRAQIKAVLVDLMLSVEPRIQKVISDALSIISESDFPHGWQELLPQLVSKFATQDWNIINGVLRTIHSILRRYRHQFRSDTILGELKFILQHLQKPYHELFNVTLQAIAANINNEEALKTLFTTANLLCKIFHSLNAVDLPEYFEDNMNTFMPAFHQFLHFQTSFKALLEGDKEETPGLLQKLQANVCVNLNLYIEKYEEEFASFLPEFVQDVWTLLAKADNHPKYDRLVNAMIHFLTSVAKSIHHTLFAPEEILKQICGFIVIPNMKIRETDEEIFEDNPAEYIRRDAEGSDTDTRRRAALELVKGLRKHYEVRVTQLFSADITNMLASGNWIAKDTAIYLVTALAVKSTTAASGTTSTNELVPIVDFCRAQILPELAQPTSKNPILKATCIKFITTFRLQLPVAVYGEAFPHLGGMLKDPNYVIHSYAATCVERLLTVRDKGQLRIGSIKDFVGPLLTNLFETLSTKESQENEYIMKAVMRVISVAGPDIAPFAPVCLQKLVEILGRIAANPTNPLFNHFVFEAVGALIKNTIAAQGPASVAQFEGVLFPAFQTILQMDIVEFAPYVFQLLSLMLESCPTPISPAYAGILPPLLMVVMWERKSNIPALIRLVQAYLRKGTAIVISGNHLVPILGIFQKKLNRSKMHDHEGFYLLEAIVENLSFADFDQYLPDIFKEIFTRMSADKTLKYVKSFLVFLCLFVAKHGPSNVIGRIDSLQPNLFSMVVGTLIGNVGKVNGKIERKICSVGMIKLLTESPEMLTTYVSFWPQLLNALLGVLELPEDESEHPPGEFAHEEDDEAQEHTFTSAAFTPLSYAAKQDVDPFPNVDVKKYLATQLHQISSQPPVAAQLRTLPGDSLKVLTAYYQHAGIQAPVVVG